MHSNGELSITNNPEAAASSSIPLTVAEAAAAATAPPTFTLRPVLSALSTHWTGAGGGTMLTVTLDDGSAAFDVANPDANQVSCTVHSKHIYFSTCDNSCLPLDPCILLAMSHGN